MSQNTANDTTSTNKPTDGGLGAIVDFNPETAEKWMNTFSPILADRFTKLVRPMRLATECAAAFGVADCGGPLDDMNHWIWTVAMSVSNAYNREAEKGK